MAAPILSSGNSQSTQPVALDPSPSAPVNIEREVSPYNSPGILSRLQASTPESLTGDESEARALGILFSDLKTTD